MPIFPSVHLPSVVLERRVSASGQGDRAQIAAVDVSLRVLGIRIGLGAGMN